MLKIQEGEPWVMWPDKLVGNFIDYPANKIFDYDGDYEFTIDFEFERPILKKQTLFSKLPSYFGFDLEPNGFTFIYTEEDNNTEYVSVNYQWQHKERYKLKILKRSFEIFIYIDDILIMTEFLKTKLKVDDISHIIFGAGNFPKNGFNLNYFSVILHSVKIIKDSELISDHEFNKFIHNKSFDLTNNCNFIYKI